MRTDRSALQPGGVQLDLSYIAKGHAVDLVLASLRALGIGNALMEAGGELRASAGGRMDRRGASPWKVRRRRV
jgi:thiamine biosynthesis lipoprotein